MPPLQGGAFLPVGYDLYNAEKGYSYKIVKLLGHGGYGATYEVRDANNRRLALKELFPGAIVSRRDDYTVSVNCKHEDYIALMNSFRKEATVISSLADIKSVVKIFDYFSANNTSYYVMEFISGSTLLQYICDKGLLDAETFLPKFRRLMDDVQLLHERKVLHRDISPDNIMLADNGDLKLIDFGSARFFEGSQHFTVSIKEDFAPIEQYSTNGQGPYTDVYSMAATLYYSFTGKRVPNCVKRLKQDTLVPPSQYNSVFNQEQESALMKALAVKSADRYQAMREFKAAFFQEQAPVLKTNAKTKAPTNTFTGSSSGFACSWAKLKANPALLVMSGVLFLLAAILQFF